MKKIALLTLVMSMMSLNAFALSGDIIPSSQSSSVGVDYIQSDVAVNVDGMKRADKVKDAETKARKNEKNRIQINNSDLNRQRALNYSTERTNVTLPSLR